MIVEFFRYGAGLSKGPLDYFLGKKRDREHAKILSGNEQEVAGLIDSSPFAKKYTSGCLSFYESDLSDEAKRKIMADFEHCLFPGMSSDQYRVLWIEHRDKINEETGERRLELNFLIPNTEILTGNRLQPFYHEADMPRVDLFKKIINFEHQLHDPDDPMFRQDIKTKKSLPKNTADIKRVLDVAAKKQIEEGFITDRESMKQWLIDLGLDVTKETAKAISIRNPYGDENSRPIRLEGAIYEQNFRFGAEGDSLAAEASERYRREARKRYRENLQRYAEQIDGKIREFQQKYQQRDAELEKAGHASHERAKDPNLDQQGGVEKSAERSHERDYRADYNRQEDVAESTYRSNHRNSGSLPEASRELTGELARVEPLTRRDSTPSDFEKSPYYVSLAVDYSSWRFSYEQYRNGTLSKLPKKSVKPNEPANRGFTSEGSNLESFDLRQTIVRTDRPESSALRGQLSGNSGEIEVNEQSRSAAIADYRGTTAAIEAATTAAARSLDAYSGSSTDYRRARELHRDFEKQEQQANREEQSVSGADNHLSGDSEKAIRANSLRAFFRGFTERIGDRFKDACDEIGEFFRRTRRIEKLVKGDFAELDRNRDRNAAQATHGATIKQTGLSRELSRKVSGFNTGSIFKALDVLDQRKELQAKQRAAERSSGLDCEM
ncbi:relaxase/mobilization nuclease domain protein [Acinetobacter lwoffii SH145]|uniref:relaxase/mobilization nuclease domain-containing protein n=1 Tax=Acinetobacter lwoffii TaxID=28090 RepID=UPI0001BBABAA|nr:relaxase/mobilization nuclease domain-containing protein [Acinetobacter lwoffii]EEY88343.1 relaxase/mobilization nuclease domain protein [Acinetobacter lwoffii SH145]